MSWVRRAWPALGIVSWIIAFMGLGIHGYPVVNASPQQLADWASRTDTVRFEVGITVEAAGILLFLFFVAWLCDALRRSGGPLWLLGLALVATAVWAAGSVLTNGVWMALLGAGKNARDVGILASMRDIAQELYHADNLLLAPALAALGLAAAQSTALPRWLSWALFVIGVATIVPPLSMLLQLAFVLWVAIVSVLLVVRAPAATTTSSPSLA